MSTPFDFLGPAAALAREIADAAVWFDGRCSWMGARAGDVSRALGSERVHAALGPDLYDGTSGVALFLAEAAVRLGDDQLRSTALGALRHAVDHAGRLGDGLYAGRLGVAYAATRVAQLTAADVALVQRMLGEWRRDRAEPQALDVFSGAAGSVLGLLAVGKVLDEPWLLERAIELGDVLVSRANRSPAGWSWPDPAERDIHDLCGYSHGAAGIGHALLDAGDTQLASDIGRLGTDLDGDLPCGVPEGQTPGLFLGLSGVGLFYLRLADRTVATPLIVHADGEG
jgi:lantibiotic modifying enzyme